MATTTALPLWIGTYPAPGQDAGSGEGVWRVDVAPDGTFGVPTLAAASSAPSFLALHPGGHTLYAVGETAEGTVSAFRVDGESLGQPVTISSGGDSPCHLLALDDVLWVANYGDGVAAAVPLTVRTGAPAAGAVTYAAPEGTGAHAHFCAVVGDDVVVADLGLDAVRRYPAHPAAGAAAPEPVVAARLAPGSGPRHLVVLEDGSLVVAGELDSRLHVLAPGDAGWAPSSSTPAAATPGEVGPYPSHVTLTGDLLLVGVRGAEVLAAHRVTRHVGGRATVEHLADVDLGAGAWPRHHEVVGRADDGRLLVVLALQGTAELVSVLVDPVSGAGEVAARLPFATPPACVLPAREPAGESTP